MASPLATWGWWWRAGMCLVWATYLALAYMVARGTAGGWSGVGTVLLGVTGALGATIFLLPLVPLLDAEEVVRATRAGRRFARGECPACGQPRAPGTESGAGAGAGADPCAECGAAFSKPSPWIPSWTTAGRFAVVLAVALVLGVVAGEWRLRADEADFRAEAPGLAATVGSLLVVGSPAGGTSAGDTSVSWERYRRWPADFSLLRYESDGRAPKFSAPPPFEFERIPGWQPSRPR
jgi:hypothetical protein